ncbi:hypothetical protein K504DRAFT_464565 [Pleomassaria siparia CBS 279.74]|uniref:Uncharacterized protein n=1 Tax=Pleomassaria siparia CBS 279.74 TaxID=1314801 RepID=A0A6G1KHU2_9PLEO|nr:hypothetical protein K504DRAFT_464565 [Pleomassaria siparia CBS 279.74]
MSSFKRLAIRTKKSLSGIYSSIGDGDQKSHQQEVAAGRPLTTTSPVPEAPNIEGFRTFGDGSPAPGKDSPSKRKRLLGSLRSVGSMRSLRSSFTKPDEEPSAIPEV